MGMLMLLMLRDIECGMIEISMDFTSILASVNVENISVFLSTCNSPPDPLAMDSKFVVFQESKGKSLLISIL